MKKILIRINAFIKGLVLLARPHIYLGWLGSPFKFLANTLSLSRWIAKQEKKGIVNDFYTPRRVYGRRFDLYRYVSEEYGLDNKAYDYIELGVAAGHSFKWWVNNSKNSSARFFGFDTFEGLPEDWGTFSRSDMAASVPLMDDTRVQFFKGLFQDTIPGFLKYYSQRENNLKVIHLDADLFSSTLFALTSIAPYLRKGDILIFDEFNVPNHEFLAYKMFTESYYIKTRLIGAVNNYLQVAMVID